MRIVLAEHELVTGEVKLRELHRVLVEKFLAPESVAASVAAQLHDHVIVPVPKVLPPIPVRDPDDAWELASALASGADVLVSGDQDLLELAGAGLIAILSPRQAWEQLRGDPDRGA